MRENAAAAAGTHKLGLTPALTEFLIEARSSTGEMTEGQEDRTGGQNKATAATAATALETEEGTPVQKYNGYNSSRPTNNSGNYGNNKDDRTMTRNNASRSAHLKTARADQSAVHW